MDKGADAIVRSVCADWGIWPDDYYPSAWHENIPLNEQFANQIDFDEAVEHWEVFALARSIAHHAYANGPGTISFPSDVPDFDILSVGHRK